MPAAAGARGPVLQCGLLWTLVCGNEKGRRPMPLRAPAKGHSRTAWPTPRSHGACGPEAASAIQEHEGSGWRFARRQLDATRVDQIVVMAVKRPSLSSHSVSSGIIEPSGGPDSVGRDHLSVYSGGTAWQAYRKRISGGGIVPDDRWRKSLAGIVFRAAARQVRRFGPAGAIEPMGDQRGEIMPAVEIPADGLDAELDCVRPARIVG